MTELILSLFVRSVGKNVDLSMSKGARLQGRLEEFDETKGEALIKTIFDESVAVKCRYVTALRVWPS